ncbi:unnamed protein product [Camellia sinensis]
MVGEKAIVFARHGRRELERAFGSLVMLLQQLRFERVGFIVIAIAGTTIQLQVKKVFAFGKKWGLNLLDKKA